MYNQVYGKYSAGGGKILRDRDKVFASLDDQDIIKDSVMSLAKDLNRLKVSIKDKVFLDVGTGRQAVAALKLGAKKVRHYDISRYNVRNVRKYTREHKLPIITKQVDLVEYAPRKADLVYLHGIVQHFSHVGKGLKNCLDSVVVGGVVWLYFYRSGTFKQFVIYLLRDLIKETKNIDEFFLNAAILYSGDVTPNYMVSGMMDDFFADYVYLYEPKMYLQFLRDAGFEIKFSSKLEPRAASVDHSFHESVIIGAKRIREGTPDTSLLAPEKSINQLSIKYKNKYIADTVYAYNRLKKNIRFIPRSSVMLLAFKIFEFTQNADIKEVKKNNIRLQEMLNNTLKTSKITR